MQVSQPASGADYSGPVGDPVAPEPSDCECFDGEVTIPGSQIVFSSSNFGYRHIYSDPQGGTQIPFAQPLGGQFNLFGANQILFGESASDPPPFYRYGIGRALRTTTSFDGSPYAFLYFGLSIQLFVETLPPGTTIDSAIFRYEVLENSPSPMTITLRGIANGTIDGPAPLTDNYFDYLDFITFGAPFIFDLTDWTPGIKQIDVTTLIQEMVNFSAGSTGNVYLVLSPDVAEAEDNSAAIQSAGAVTLTVDFTPI